MIFYTLRPRSHCNGETEKESGDYTLWICQSEFSLEKAMFCKCLWYKGIWQRNGCACLPEEGKKNGGASAFFSECLSVPKNSCKMLIYKSKSRKRNSIKYASFLEKTFNGISLILHHLSSKQPN